MDSRKSKGSVIARLMGVDELPPPESIQKTKRVLSENYMHRVASIGVRKKRSFHECHSIRMSLKEKKDYKDGSRITSGFPESPEFVDSRNDCFEGNNPKRNSLFSKDVDNLQVKFALSHSGDKTGLKSPSTPVHRNVDSFRKSRIRTEFGYLKPPQMLVNGTATTSHGNQLSGRFHDTVRSQLKPQINECSSNMPTFVSKLLHGKSKNSERYFSVPTTHSGVNKCIEFSGPDMLVGSEVKDWNKFGRDMEVIRRRSTAKSETFATASMSSSYPSDWKRRHNLFPDKSFASEAKKKLSERHPMAQNVKDIVPGSKDNTFSELLATQNHDSRRRNHKPEYGRHGLKNLDLYRLSKEQIKYEAFRSKWCLRSNKSLNLARLKLRKYNSDEDNMKLKSGISKSLASWDLEDSHSYFDTKDNNSFQDIWTRKHEMKKKLDDCNLYKQSIRPPKPLISTVSFVSMAADMVMDTETEIAMKPSGKSEVEQLGSTSSIMSEESDDCSSRATDGSGQQETSVGFHEESYMFPNCYGMELDPMVILEEACHPSPISVLERPFGEETMHGSEFLGKIVDDIYDLRRQLDLLKSESSESYTEEPEMAVSSDDENEEGLAGESIENKAFVKICRVEESWKFSYLIDVLAYASLNGGNLADFSSWHSLDCPISLSVFETLEKKYGDEMSWKRSERQLFFDRMNARIAEILLLCIGVHTLEKSVSRRFSAIRDEEMLEEDLWNLLVCQEKECSKNGAEKMVESELGKLDLGDEIYAIGREIERLLFDELLEEFLSMESF